MILALVGQLEFSLQQLMLLQLVVEFNIGAGCELVAGEILAWFG